jgi:hypothetical protein
MTTVVEYAYGARLVLEARIQALGVFIVAFEFEDEPGGCTLTVREKAVGGLLVLPALRYLAEAGITLRNAALCWRFRRLVEYRNAS